MDKEIKLNQCLFGYDDGHRLLASSVNLSTQIRSALLPLSDLASGISVNDSDGYWTGVPLPNLKHYALMKTWPAPEMPRPGCVWTHILLIPFTEFPSIGELSWLKQFFRRPSFPFIKDLYSSPILVSPGDTRKSDRRSLERALYGQVLRSFYKIDKAEPLQAPSGVLDDVIFAVWSQQWPRLRRTFSFRTAGSADENQNQQFDLKVITHVGSQYRTYDQTWKTPLDTAMWEEFAIDDLMSGQHTPLRRFLWRYGADIRRGRERFGFLIKMFLNNHNFCKKSERGEFETMLLEVAEILPEREDGLSLKLDLISCGLEPLTQLIRGDRWELLEAFIKHESLSNFPVPTDDFIKNTIESASPTYSKAFALGKKAVESRIEFADRYIMLFAQTINPSRFFTGAKDDLRLVTAMVRAAPDLLDFEELAQVSQDELLGLLELLPNSPELIERTVDRLLELESRPIANYLVRKYPQIVLHQLARHLDQNSGRNIQHVAGTWLYVAADCAVDLLGEGLLRQIRSTKDLAMIASILGYRNVGSVDSSPIAWANALSGSVDDVTGPQRQMLLAFFLSIALQTPMRGCEPLFEMSFESVHSDIWSVRLPHQASVLLNGLLPDVGWWQQWDTCLRLRMAVCDAYVKVGLSVDSFKRLTNDRQLYGRLVEEIDESTEGRRFLSKVL